MSTKEADRLGIVQAVVDKRMKQREAAERLGLTDRQVRRLAQRYERGGPAGLVSRHRGAAPPSSPSSRFLPLTKGALSPLPESGHFSLAKKRTFQLGVDK